MAERRDFRDRRDDRRRMSPEERREQAAKMREQRKAQAERHIATVRMAFSAETQAAIESARIIEDGATAKMAIPEPAHEQSTIEVLAQNTVDAVYAAEGKVMVLDFASFTNPGGGYANGAFAQEEAICSESNLYNILVELKKDFYDANRTYQRGGLYTSRAIYLTDVAFTRNGVLKKADVIVMAAPNRRFALQNKRSEKECDADMRRRVIAVMELAAAEGCDTLVLGAFGCGVFGNDATMVANLFKEWLDAHPGQFERVVFPVPGGPNLDAFREVFGVEKPEFKRVEEDDEDEDDDDDWRKDLELPEGVTLR